MQNGGDNLPAADWVAAAVAADVEDDAGAIVGFDDALEIGQERPVGARPRLVGALELAVDPAFDGALGQVEVVRLRSLVATDVDTPPLRVRHTDAIQELQLALAAVR